MDILLFGDQTSDQSQFLRRASVKRDNTNAAKFLERVGAALREEIQYLPRSRRELFPDFLTVNNLVEAYYEQSLRIPELESALVTTSQLVHYISYHEDRSCELNKLEESRVIGLCTGLIAATTINSTKCLSDLISLSVEAVRVAFRTGTIVGAAKDVLEHATSNTESWSTILSGISEATAQSALDAFHVARNIDLSSQAYVSAISITAVTISGPPETTRRLFKDSEVLDKAHRISIPVYAPYHAQHLYSDADVDHILVEKSQALFKKYNPIGKVYSASTGEFLEAGNSLELLRTVLRDILGHPVRWNKVLDAVLAQNSEAGIQNCKIKTFGVASVVNSLVAALKSSNCSSVEVEDFTTLEVPAQSNSGRTQNDKIAIVGMAGRFPEADNPEELWDLLLKGLDVHKEIPKDRFDAQAHCDPSGKGKNKTHTPYGCFIKEPGQFDPRFFNMSPREAAQTDPMGRLALVTAYEALEMSGYVPNRTPSTKLHRIGTFYGQTSDDWREINAAENIDTYFITGGVRAFAAGRINYYFKFSGPSFSIDTACSSSLAAIQLACTSLWAGDCDTACAGGLNVLTNPDIFSGLSKGQFLSKTGSCKTYDNDADGYCRGDGCGTVILKRYQDAIADKDNILGCILSAGTNHSAEAVSITHPHAGAQEFLYKKVLADAGIDAHEVSYVEMHGTGTQAGDGIEMTSVTNAFAPPHRRRRADQPLYLGAVKANIGHGEAASGINSLIKVMMMLKKNQIPPNVGIKGVMNKGFPKDLRERNVHIPLKTTDLLRHGEQRRKIFLNNFSAAGGNSALLIEDGPSAGFPDKEDPRSHQIITVSARAISSLKKIINNLVEYVDCHSNLDLSSFSYTTTARRLQHNYRVAFTAANVTEVRNSLLAQLKDTYSPVPMVSTSVAFAFTGQGSQYTGLGQKLYEDLSSFKKDVDQLDNIARRNDLPSFLPVLEGADISTLSPVVVQLAMACIQVALARMWAAWGIKPVVVVGHSLGEYAALHVAGVISATDMVRLVGRRAQLLVSNCTEFTHGMLAVKGTVDAISEALGSRMTEIACKNGPEEVVLCGTIDTVNEVSQSLAANGFKSTLLRVPFAFHSAQVEPILDAFREVASSVVFSEPVIPVLSSLTGKAIVSSGVFNADYLVRHARETVDFRSALLDGCEQKLFSEKTAWLEVGAHPVCSGMLRSSLDWTPVAAPSLRRNEDTWKTITTSLCLLYSAGVSINFDEYHREFNDAQHLLTLPTYSFDNKNYWLDYHNNWCLTKGEAQVAAKSEEKAEQVSKLSTTSCQRIVSEEILANSGTVVVQSDLAEPKLHAAVSGHLVNDAPLCPSSLYADMALTVVDYLYKQLRPKAPPMGYNVCKMEVPKPLIAKLPPPPEGQHIQVEATADLEVGQAQVKYRSVTAEGKLIQEHAHCLVKFEDIQAWNETWSMTRFLVARQIESLKQKLSSGSAHKVLRGMAYKLFKALVTYDNKYRGMEEVIIDGKDPEATATIKFQADEKDGNFVCSPYWIDSLAHLSGFVCNGTDLVDSEQNVFISHGWSSMRFARSFSADKTYQSYVRMEQQPNNVRAGDVYIFEGDEIVGIVGGLKFQQIPRRILDAMLPPLKARTNSSAGLVAKPTPAVTAKAQSGSSPQSPKSKSNRPSLCEIPSAKAAARKMAGPSTTAKVMNIIAAETDVDMSELVDAAAFDNLGVDSLMSLTISAKFREELEMDIPSTLFTDYPTVGTMKKFFSQFDVVTPSTESSHHSSELESDYSDLPSDSDSASTAISSPPSSPPSVADDDERPEKPSQPSTGEASIARLIIAAEMGVGVGDIGDQADLTEMGMDSLMSLTILSALREQTGIDLPSTFLVTNVTIEDVENALGMRPKPRAQAPAQKAERPKLKRVTESQLNILDAKLQACKKDVSKCPPATSVLLQGNAKTATTTLFLLPDGSGSAYSYINIPSIGRDVAVYGLNCPFMKKPQDFVVGVDGISALYVNEMKRRRPQGPYYLGGWSAGGVLAYEVACQLMAQGDQVARLLLLDAPCPVALDPLPARLHIFFDQIGLLGTNGTGSKPDWLLPHFAASIKALSDYEPQPMPRRAAPPTLAIWAREGVCGKPGDPRPAPTEAEDPAPMKWLLENRTDFGDNGWAQLLGNEALTFEVMDGNHFTMMRDQHAITLGSLMKKGLGLSS